MPLTLKKVFKANDEHEDIYDELRLSTIELQVLENEIRAAKRKYTLTLKKRSCLINELLFNFDFELDVTDKVVFNDHTGEIRVYKEDYSPFTASNRRDSGEIPE